MKKIPTLFKRGEDGLVIPEVTPGCEWVGDPAVPQVATRKWDGTCVSVTPDGQWWARREVKPGKTPPDAFVLEEFDENTGKSFGWEPIEQSSFYKAFQSVEDVPSAIGAYDRLTFELIGPKINGNPEEVSRHVLEPHGDVVLRDVPTDYESLHRWLWAYDGEGIVWWSDEGRAKIKRRDFGWRRKGQVSAVMPQREEGR